MAYSVDGKIWLAIKSRLDQFLGATVIMPMEAANPEATDAFIVVQNVSTDYSGVLPIEPVCGSPLVGFVSLGVCAPTDWTYAQLAGLASRVADHFNDGLRMTYQNVTVEVTRRSKVSGAVQLQAPWNRLDVRVDWRCWG